jgi:hypothetical protein
MPTPAERKALLFLAGVIVLGVGVRVVRAARDDGSSNPATRQALARQLAAVDSAHGSDSRSIRRGAGTSRSLQRRGGQRRSRGRTAVDSSVTRDSAERWVREPLSESIDHATRDASAKPVLPVDLDVAIEADIERLPRIGPVLAKRIIEDRSSRGPFGSIEGFERVRGVGPSLAAALRGRVTFSGTARPSNAVVDPRLRSFPTSSKSPRRERKN